MSALRRVRAHVGHFILLAVLAIVTALLLTAVPRVANGLADDGLRADLTDLPWQVRDITYGMNLDPREPSTGLRPMVDELDHLQESMPPPLRSVLSERWFGAQVGPNGMVATGPDLADQVGPPLELGLRAMDGAREAVRMVDGRWPSDPAEPGAPIEAAVSTEVAAATGLRAGSELTLLPQHRVTIVGIFEPVERDAGIWDAADGVLKIIPAVNDGDPNLAVALTTDATLWGPKAAQWPLKVTWRYRVDLDRLDVVQAAQVVAAMRELHRTRPRYLSLTLGLHLRLQEFLDSLASVQALLGVVTAGLLASLFGLIALAARLATDRREAEFGLLRARGGSMTTVTGRNVVESLLIVPAATTLGWAAGALVPGRAAGTGWAVLLATVAITFALPVVALLHRPSGSGRRDLVAARASAGRLTAEVSVLVLAALGAFLLRQRGLPTTGTVDPLLLSVPVLVALAATVLVLRAYPWPLRLLGRLAVRARGAVAFLGMARAGRATAATGPIMVLVVATATAAFCGAVAAGISGGRDRAAELAIPADVALTGDGFTLDTADELASLPGVRAVASVLTRTNERLYETPNEQRSGVEPLRVVVLDGPAFARVVAESGVGVDVPTVLTDAIAGSDPLPAVVSESVAADVPERGFVSLAERRHEFRVAAVVEDFPGVPRNVRRFIVLPWQAMPPQLELDPNGFLIAASTVDEAALWEVGDRGRRRWLGREVTDREVGLTVTTRAGYRAELEDSGINGLLSFAFGAGAVGGAALGLLAVAFVVVTGARARGRVLSRLRTLGLSRQQARGLLIYELTPLVGVAVLTGGTVGALLPVLLAPVLQLSTFTDGMPVPVRFEPGVVGGVVVLGALALGAAIAVEATINRRMRLGEVLRLGEES